MILVDTSIWIDHFRRGDAALARLLEQGSILCHPFVIGELALGGLVHRREILTHLAELPKASVADDEEVLRFIEMEALAGSGVGYIDAHLLAATRLTAGAHLWTRDRRLAELAGQLKLGLT